MTLMPVMKTKTGTTPLATLCMIYYTTIAMQSGPDYERPYAEAYTSLYDNSALCAMQHVHRSIC